MEPSHAITVICPHCDTGLRVQTDLTAAVVVCPRCQSRFPNPEKAEETGTRAILAKEHSSSEGGDWYATSPLVIVGALGIAVGCMLVAELANWAVGLAVIAGSLVWLGLISLGAMMWQTRDRPQERNAARLIVGMLVLAGIVFLVSPALVIVYFVVRAAGL